MWKSTKPTITYKSHNQKQYSQIYLNVDVHTWRNNLSQFFSELDK